MPDFEKIIFIIHMREKCSKQKICSMRSHKVTYGLFLEFFVKRKENDLQRNYRLFGSPAENLFSYNFTDGTKLVIVFHLQRLGPEHHRRFLNFCKLKFRKYFTIFSLTFHVFMLIF